MFDDSSPLVKRATELSRELEKSLDGGAERWTQAQVQLISHAQRAVRQALYFTRLVEVDADATLRTHVRNSVRRLLASVPVLDAKTTSGEARFIGAKESYQQLADRWDALLKSCNTECDVAALQTLETKLCDFLTASATDSLFIHLTYTRLPAIARAIGQHLGFWVGFVIGLTVLFGVEAVSSLFRNSWLYAAVAILFAILPSVLLLWIERHVRKSRTPVWDVGGRVAREVRPTLVEPEPWVPWHPPGGHYTSRIYAGLALKAMLYVAIWVILWFVLRLLVVAFHWEAPLLTVYLIAVLLAGLAFAGAALDFVDIHSQAPVRGILLSGVVVTGVSILLTDRTGWQLLWPSIWALIVLVWVWRIRQARATMALLGGITVVITALLTTTSRIDAGRWVEKADAPRTSFIDPAEWPAPSDGAPVVVMAASGGGSRAAIMAAHTLQRLQTEHPRIAENLQAISSVSGGSLATAAYVTRQLWASGRDTTEIPVCDVPLLDAMREDFLRPTLLGVLPFAGGRAEAIQRAWQRCPTAIGTVRISRLAQLWRARAAESPGSAPPFAVPIFNSASLDRHDVVITPLDGSLFRQPLDSFARVSPDSAPRDAFHPPSTWVHFRSGIYQLGDLGPRLDPTLAESVRASANFPFGFPLVEVATTERLWYSPRDEELDSGTTKVVRLTDGGALSNSGLWPLLPLLLNKRAAIGRRGVLLIIVDASRMPTVGAMDRQLGLVATLLDKAPKSERSHFQMLEQLQGAYGDCFAVVQIAIEPLERNNIHTTWALDDRSRARLDTLFDDSWRLAGPRIASAFTALRSCTGNQSALRMRRVPVD